MQLSQSLLDQVLTLANEAGKHLARFYQQDVAIQTKSDNTPVTEADLFVSQFLIEKLTELFPDNPSFFQRKTAIFPLNNAKLGKPIG